MDLHEDAYRLQEVLTDASYEQIVNFLRTKVAFSDTEDRCRIALQYFLNRENELAKNNNRYEDDLRADFLCVRHLLKAVPDDQIRNTLEVLGSIPNRKHVAAKLLLHDSNCNLRKRKKSKNKPGEASGSKLVKVEDSANSDEAKLNGTEHSKIPKLVLKRDRNANEFMVTSPMKTRSRHNFPPHINTFEEHVKVEEPAENGFHLHDIKVEPLFEDNFIPDNGAPGPSRLLDNEEAGPSGVADLPHSKLDDLTDAMQRAVEQPTGGGDAVIDLSSSNGSVAIPEVLHDEPMVTEGPAEGPPVALAVDEKLVLKIMEMFPEALPDYIRGICAGKVWSDTTFAEIVDVILSDDNYPRRPERQPSPEKEVDPEEQLVMLKALLPDADPMFLQERLEELVGDQEGLRKFIEDAVDNKNYPTMKDYLRQQQLSAQQRQYTTEFNVERFLELFPEPVALFEDPKRKTTIVDQSDKCYVKWFMRNKYSQLYAKDISNIVETHCTTNIISIVLALDKCLTQGYLKKTKWFSNLRPDSQNIPLLQELAYFQHKYKILTHLEAKKEQAAEDRQNAKELGLLQTCSCCFDDEVMPFDILTCTGGCRFCRDCIKRSTEVAFGEGKVNFPCLSGECDAEFSLPVLQSVLPPKLFSKLAQKKAVAEVQAAGVEDLETCPFCDFANIPAPEDKLFRCLNPDCMKESCRLCKEPSHVPLRCEEVEKDEAIKARTYIENKMTEALIRECWKCGAKFIKEEGCNKMTCSCGAMMCYICRQPVKDYKHFNGQGGDQYHLCPLYTDNFSVNEKNVLKAAEDAKKEVDPTQLKNDPTADLQKHFGDKIKEAEKQQAQRQAPPINRRAYGAYVDVAHLQVRHHGQRHRYRVPPRHVIQVEFEPHVYRANLPIQPLQYRPPQGAQPAQQIVVQHEYHAQDHPAFDPYQQDAPPFDPHQQDANPLDLYLQPVEPLDPYRHDPPQDPYPMDR